ncbi:hypothetical protein L1049_010942 [Liquidambar formosana]|uniref:Malectin-like domain-containing protein n=1 Tax=Liquidambar formosana TaxID=63359 RepID=A0AAP0RUL1_LIQFO
MKNTKNLCFSFILLLLCHPSFLLASNETLLNCGGATQTSDTDGRQWTSDIHSTFAPMADNTLTSPALTQDPSVPQVPFMTARIFHSMFTYIFPVASGRNFVRLYFYPSSYAGLSASAAVFSVTTGPYTLLRNFSVSETTQALNYAFIVKEFSVSVVGSSLLNITFTPSPKLSNSYAFVNGIEIVSMPDIYATTATLVGQSTPFVVANSTALEKVSRLNVGGSDISPTGDTGLFRSWSDDFPYIFSAANGVAISAPSNMTIEYPPGFPNYVAPVHVYSTARSMGPTDYVNHNYNLTWVFQIDSGFYYLVRLHFCEIQPLFTKINQRVFNIFINNQTAVDGADVVGWAGGNGIPVYKDYVAYVPEGNGQQDLWVELHPNVESLSSWYDAILNGLEIFKVNDSTGNLAGPNPIPVPKQEVINPTAINPVSGSENSKNHTAIIIGGILGGIAAVSCLIFLLVFRHHRQGKHSSSSYGPPGWLPLSLYGYSNSTGSGKTHTTSVMQLVQAEVEEV